MMMRWLILSLMISVPFSGEARVLGTHIYNRHKAENRYYEQDAMDGGSVEPLKFPQKKLPDIDEDTSYDERAAQLRLWLNQRAAQRNPAHAEKRSEGLAGNLVDMPYVGHGHHRVQSRHQSHHGKDPRPASSGHKNSAHHVARVQVLKPLRAQQPSSSSGSGKGKQSRTLRNSG